MAQLEHIEAIEKRLWSAADTLRAKIEELNPGLPGSAYDDAVRQIVTVSASQTMAKTNREKHELIKDGVQVTFRNAKGDRMRQRLRVFDFDNPENNHFRCVRELWVRGDLYRRRADIVGFVNGLPLLFMELKNVSKDIRAAYEQNFLDYRDTVPHLFHHNAFVVLANGVNAKLGSLTSRFEHFHDWKRLAENQPGVVGMETLLKGVCAKANFLDLVENFIVFDDSAGESRKILACDHQFLGVNRAIAAVRDRKSRNGKLGVFWHTQGSGKSYSMVLFTRKVHRKLGGNFTFLILTDRDDLIVITDEAHRTQYGTLALNMQSALPNASYIGFTGTPLFKDDDLQKHWPTDAEHTYVDFIRHGSWGEGEARSGSARWRRITEERAGAKSVFHFDVPGSVAKSTHVGLPWLRYLRNQLGERLHFWPFDGWEIPAGKSALVEVYPSLWSKSTPREGRTPDQHDAYVAAAWLRQVDTDGSLRKFLKPDMLPGEYPVAQVEGWILGVM